MISVQSLNTAFKKSSSLKIAVIGDVMLDEYHWCDAKRLSQEAPVPICSVKNTTLVPGGAANVAYNLTSMGISADLYGIIGHDSSGDKLLNVLNQSQINHKGVIKSTKPTILKSRIIANQQQVVRVDREPEGSISISERHRLFSILSDQISNYDVIILSDYLKGLLVPSFTQKIIQLAKQQETTIIVDPKGPNYLKYKQATLITPNFSEFMEVTQKQFSKESEILKSSLQLIKKLSISGLLITRSEKGMSYIHANKKTDIPTQAKDVCDITGAGDTVVAVLSVCCALGFNHKEAAHIANIAAGIVVGKLGTATVTFQEIIDTFYD